MRITPKRVAIAAGGVLAAAFVFRPRRRARRAGGGGSGGSDSGASSELNRFGFAFARAADALTWPLQGTASRKVSTDIGDARPFGSSNPSRHHAGEDLVAPEGTVLVATESGTVVAIDDSWYSRERDDGTKLHAGALLLQTDRGPVINYGEIAPGSPASFGIHVGSRVARGQKLARVGFTDQLHFETYRRGTTRTHQWPWDGQAPAALLDPTKYLQAAGGVVS